MRRRPLIVLAVILAALLFAPVAVKAATGGEVDLYAMVQDLLTRVDSQEEEIARMKDRIDELESELENVTAPKEPAPAPEPGQSDADGDTDEPVKQEPAPSPEPPPAPEPDPEPEPKPNPYAHLSLDNVHVAMVGDKIEFGRWQIAVTDDVSDNPYLYDYHQGGTQIIFTEAHLLSEESILKSHGVNYTIQEIYVDPLLVQMVQGVKVGSRTEAIEFIEAKIRGDK